MTTPTSPQTTYAFAPEDCYMRGFAQAPLTLAFDPAADFAPWRAAVAERLAHLLGPTPAIVPLNLRTEYVTEHDTFREYRLVYTAEEGADVPCHLLIPRAGQAPYPTMICLQGHSTGMHISLGRPKYEGDEASIAGGRDIAMQAVAMGFAALVVELRCFGERRDSRPEEVRGLRGTCTHASMASLLLGRTMIGQRVWDISRAIDMLALFPELDPTRIGCMGNSGGGTITFFSACMEPRLTAAMPSCYVCTFRDSIGSIDHCADNYIPGILNYFEMGDLAGLIAPRPLVVVAGQHDPIFPIAAVHETFGKIQAIYAKAGVPERCKLVVGPKGHQFYPEEAWPVFHGLTGWQG